MRDLLFYLEIKIEELILKFNKKSSMTKILERYEEI